MKNQFTNEYGSVTVRKEGEWIWVFWKTLGCKCREKKKKEKAHQKIFTY